MKIDYFMKRKEKLEQIQLNVKNELEDDDTIDEFILKKFKIENELNDNTMQSK